MTRRQTLGDNWVDRVRLPKAKKSLPNNGEDTIQVRRSAWSTVTVIQKGEKTPSEELGKS
jgi:hypothetical protein